MLNNLKSKNLKNDIFAGIIVALVSIPISLGYAQIAGLPAVYGLYGSLLPVLIYGLITSSPQFVFGVDATPAALVGGSLAEFGIISGSQEAMGLVPVITLAVAMWLLIFYFLKAGRIVSYISMPVMGGFITGIGLTIILMQVSKLFGGGAGTGELFELLAHIYGQLEHFNLLSFILGFGTVLVILFSKKIAPKFPMSVIILILGALATAFFHIDRYGVKLLPSLEAGFPDFIIPDVSLVTGKVVDIIVLSLSISVVIVAQTLLATNNYAMKYGYKVNNDREILAYSIANVGSALVGCCPLNGSVSRTGIADQFGCKSQVMSIVAAFTMLLVVLFGTPLMAYLPVPVLTGIVIAALIGILELKLAAKLKRLDSRELLIFLGAMFGVLLFGTIYGVIIGVILSFVEVIRKAVIPPKGRLGVIPGHEGFYNLDRNSNARAIKDTVIYRFSGSLFFANVDAFQKDIENYADEGAKTIIVDAGGIGSVDFTAAERLVIINNMLKNKGIHFYITEHVGNLNDEFRNLGAGVLIEEGVTRRTITLALRAAGMSRPYELVGGEDAMATIQSIEDNERLAEIEWAFGDAAAGWMDKLAEEVAHNIEERQLDEVQDLGMLIQDAEKSTAWGRVGLFDEDELLERLEMLLPEISEHTHMNKDELEKYIEQRRIEVEKKLMKLGPEVVDFLKEHRKHMAERFQKRNPKAYDELVKQRYEHIHRLEKSNPQLAAKLKKFYKIDDGDNQTEKDN